MKPIDQRIQSILDRNQRVEAEKAWETSVMRRGSIAIITYITAGMLLWAIGESLVPFKAIIPTAGYLLSTWSLPWLKRKWMSHR